MSDRVRVFLSHSHADDAFARKLADDLTHAGADVWVDFADITYDNFLKKIDEGLKDRQWLVLVMTPPALRSEFVQMEVTAALLKAVKHEMRGVIPILAAPCSDKEIPATWAPLHRYDATRDYQSALAGLINALGLNVQPDSLPNSPVPPLPGVSASASARTLIVDSQGAGDYITIAEALAAAQQGDRIEIRAGLYREGTIKITKQLELVGTGATPEDVVIMAKGGMIFEAPRGRLFNLMFDGSRCTGDTDYVPILDIQFGRPDIEHCVVANHASVANYASEGDESTSGIHVGERAAPFIARCTVRKCDPGVLVAGKAHIEGNDIGDCDSGISVHDMRDVTIRSNRVHNNGQGITIERGSAILEQNSVFANHVGISIQSGGSALARANFINANEYGVSVAGEGGGNFEDNDMRGNRREALSGNLGGVRQARNLFDPPQARR